MAADLLNENFSTNIENLKKDIVRLEMGLNKAKSDLEICLNSTKSEIMSEVLKLIDNLQAFHSKMKQFDAKFDVFERKQVSGTIVISGIPLIANESVENIFSKISNVINFEKGIEAVDCIYWMKSPKLLLGDVISKKPIPIYVLFISERLKMMFFNNYLSFKNLSLSQIGLEMNTRIYCNQYLTKYNYSTLQAAFRAKRTDNKISSVFTKGGLVYVLFKNNSKPAVLRSIDDLHNAIKQYNSAINLNTVTSIDVNMAEIFNKNQLIQEKSSITTANIDVNSNIATINTGGSKPAPATSVRITRKKKYGREDEEVMGLRFCNEAVMCLTQIWPPNENKTDEKDTLTPLQDALIKRLGDGTFPFTMEVTPQAPPSVQLVPAKRYYGAPIGTSYDIRCFVADRSDEKLHRRSTVRMGVRLIHKTNLNNLQLNKAPENFTTIINNQTDSSTSPPPISSTSATTPTPPQSVRSCKNERYDSFSKLKLSPKAFRFTGKLCRSKSEIEKSSNDFYEGITNDFESTRGPQGSVDKPFLLQEGKVCLRASLDKSVYAHGENIDVTVDIKNDSRKTVRRIRVTAIQHVDVCMFSNGKFKNVVAESDASLSDISVKPCSTLHTIYTLHPQRGPTKNWIALEDSLQRCNEPNAITALIASSALRNPASANNPDDRNVFAIYVSYYVKVKLTLSGMGGELSLKLPFTLAHIETNNSIKCDTEHVDHSPHNQQSLTNNSKRDDDNDSKLNLNLDSIMSSSATSHTLLANQACASSSTSSTNATQKSTSQQAAASLTSSFRNCNISFSNKNKLLQQQQQSTVDQDTEALDKIEQITTEDITIDQEKNNVKRKSVVMLKHTRQNTLQISSIDDDKDDDDDDNSIVGTTANDLLHSPDYDMRKNTETTCVEVHASSS